MVLVDDEFSTGRTVLNTIRVLQRTGARDLMEPVRLFLLQME